MEDAPGVVDGMVRPTLEELIEEADRLSDERFALIWQAGRNGWLEGDALGRIALGPQRYN